jgi:hypothetical protein
MHFFKSKSYVVNVMGSIVSILIFLHHPVYRERGCSVSMRATEVTAGSCDVDDHGHGGMCASGQPWPAT